jgi:hypothetical protein
VTRLEERRKTANSTEILTEYLPNAGLEREAVYSGRSFRVFRGNIFSPSS